MGLSVGGVQEWKGSGVPVGADVYGAQIVWLLTLITSFAVAPGRTQGF